MIPPESLKRAIESALLMRQNRLVRFTSENDPFVRAAQNFSEAQIRAAVDVEMVSERHAREILVVERPTLQLFRVLVAETRNAVEPKSSPESESFDVTDHGFQFEPTFFARRMHILSAIASRPFLRASSLVAALK